MTLAEFVTALSEELRLQGASFDRAELASFILSAWPIVGDGPDVIFWAYEHLKTGRATLPV